MATEDCFPDDWEAEAGGHGETEEEAEAVPMEEDEAPEPEEEADVAEAALPAGEEDADDDVDLDALEAAALSSWQQQQQQSADDAGEEEEAAAEEEEEEQQEEEESRISISVGSLKGKGKGSKSKGKGTPGDGGVGQLVAKLNKSGIWPPGKGVDVRALSSLRALPVEKAFAVVEKLESLGASISNPSQFVTLECRGLSQALGKGGGSLAAIAAKRALHEGGKGEGGKAGKGGKAGGGKDGGKSGKGKDGKGGKKGKGKKETKGSLDLHNMVLAPRPKDELPQHGAAKRPHAEAAKVASDEEAVEAPPSKRQAVQAEEAEDDEDEVEVSPALGRKLEELEAKGIELAAPAIKALAGAEERDALIVCQALTMKGKIENPSRFVTASLRKRVESKQDNLAAEKAKAEQLEEEERQTRVQAVIDKVNKPKVPVAKAKIAVPKAKAGIVPRVSIRPDEPKKVVQKVTISKGDDAAPPAVAPTPTYILERKQAEAKVQSSAARKKKLAVQTLDIGREPQLRQDLDFEQELVQAHLKALNKSGKWEPKVGDFAFDEACFVLLLKIPAHRAIEILQDIESRGNSDVSPLDMIREEVREELMKEDLPDLITSLGVLASLNKGI